MNDKKTRQLHPAMEAHKWKPGQSGNRSGRPKRKPITEIYEELLNNPETVEELRASIRRVLKRGQMAMVIMLREMAERVEGKVVTPVEADVNVSLSLAERMAKAQERLDGQVLGTAKPNSI